MIAEENNVVLKSEVTSVINYALYQNHIRVIRAVTVDNPLEKGLERVTLTVASNPSASNSLVTSLYRSAKFKE